MVVAWWHIHHHQRVTQKRGACMREGRYQEPELQSTKGVTVRNGHIEIITMILLLLFFESKLRNGSLNYRECDTSAILYNLQPTPTASHWLEEWFIAAQLLFMRMCVQSRLHCMHWTVVGLSGKSSSAIQLIYNKHSTNSISVNYPEICPVVEMSGSNSHRRSRATAGWYPSTPLLVSINLPEPTCDKNGLS